ncbi:HNH endonuclease [Sphingopyxis sp. BSN-002]|uniref:HNH endonuclease signature motif containing protein n=1 Tax=Sphingopyxis sp. BSN-002 TaxID=2911495 RepID=UPI001EDA9025|nr:HNH endonuclease signature motif containing protein [Sphingopyxis sp. BSN-002]UKK83834.1 HNH endonuclease [Sphingopyxis sp. BSN-002]
MGIFGINNPNALADILSAYGSKDSRKKMAWDRCRTPGILQIMAAGGGNLKVDDFGNVIRWENYGQTDSEYGWEVDHIQPSALGGQNHFGNLRALHWRANRSLGGFLGNALNNNPFATR